MQVKIVDSPKEPVCITEVKRAVLSLPESLPEEGWCWDVEKPEQVVVGLENLLIVLNDKLASRRANETASNGVIEVKYKLDDNNDMQSRLTKLFEEWENALSDTDKKLFNRDGFYPGYNSQKFKILFVGREACYMAKQNYIETMYANFQKNDIAGWTINQYPFQRRQAYIAYGILNNWKSWEEVPPASDICSMVGEDNGISWAFINMSKLSNETGDWRTDGNRYWPFVNDNNNQKMLKRQINILKPDIIIGANVPELTNILAYETPDTRVSDCYYYNATNDFPPFLNCFHFAAIKKDKECFYEAVRDVINKHPLNKFGWKANGCSNPAQGVNV